MKSETPPREIAEDIAKGFFPSGGDESRFCRQLSKAIEAALNAERERAAKILEDRVLALKSVKHPTTHNTWEQLDLIDLAARIRGKQ